MVIISKFKIKRMKQLMIPIIAALLLSVACAPKQADRAINQIHDSISVYDIVGTDSVYYITQLPFNSRLSIEIEYNSLDTSDGQFFLGVSNSGNTFNKLDSVTMDTAYGVTINADFPGEGRTGEAVSQLWYYDWVMGSYVAFKVKPNGVDTGYVEYWIRR